MEVGPVGRLIVLLLFISGGVAIKVCQHAVKSLEYELLCPMIIVSCGKLLLSFCMFCLQDGTPAQLLGHLRSNPVVVRNYSIVAGMYCTYDVLSFVNAALFDPQTFMVLLQLRIVLTAVVWEVAYGQSGSFHKRLGLVLITAGCVAKQALAPSSYVPKTDVNWRYLTMFVQVLANCFAGVANEMLLKNKAQATGTTPVPFSAQNMLQYGWTIMWLFLVGVLAPSDSKIGFDPLDWNVWAPMLDVRLWPSIIVLTFLGLVTSLFVKLWDAVWKNVASSLELFITGFVSYLIYGYPVFFSDFVALSIVVAGIWLFANSDGQFALLHSIQQYLGFGGKAKDKGDRNDIELQRAKGAL